MEKQFKMIHEHTEEIYRQIYEYIDEVAGHIVMKGKRPFGSLKEFAENTNVEQLNSQKYKTGEVVRHALVLVEQLRKSAHDIHEQTD